MTEENSQIPKGKQFGNEFLSNYKNVTVFSRISVFSPLIIFPLIAFYYHDWLLILGILVSYLGGLLSINLVWLIIAFVLVGIYSLIFGFSFHNHITIYFFCYLYGHITFTLGRYYEKKFEKTKSKINNQVENQVKQMLDKNQK